METLEILLLIFLGLTPGLLWGLWQQINLKNLEKTHAMLQKSHAEYRQALSELQHKNITHLQQIAELQTRNDYLNQQINAHQAKAETLETQLLHQFKNVSNDLLTQKSEQFSKQNQQQMDLLLRPLQQRITDFQQQINQNQQIAQERTLMLKHEFEKVNKLYEKMHEDAAKTTQAIMGNNKIQGTWGEVHAQHLLERTGLRKDEQYFVQKGFSTNDGKRHIPDFIIKLPGGRNIVMDVKVSLLDYMKFFNATDEKERVLYLKKHIQSIKNHVKSLSAKDYAQIYQLHGLDFVLLLLPLEPAFALAIQHEPSLFEEAYAQNIVLVSPTTLQGVLSMIAYLWKEHKRNHHALQIAKEGGKIYDGIAGFVEDLKKISHQLHLGQKSCESAMKKLAEGRGNLISRAEKIKELGARTSKNLSISSDDS